MLVTSGVWCTQWYEEFDVHNGMNPSLSGFCSKIPHWDRIERVLTYLVRTIDHTLYFDRLGVLFQGYPNCERPWWALVAFYMCSCWMHHLLTKQEIRNDFIVDDENRIYGCCKKLSIEKFQKLRDGTACKWSLHTPQLLSICAWSFSGTWSLWSSPTWSLWSSPQWQQVNDGLLQSLQVPFKDQAHNDKIFLHKEQEEEKVLLKRTPTGLIVVDSLTKPLTLDVFEHMLELWAQGDGNVKLHFNR